jgi:hypothetical protein
VGRAGEATVVPKDALVLGGGVPMVYAVDVSPGDGPEGINVGRVRPVEVSLGATVAGNVEARGGIEPGQLVVVRGNERLRPGMTVSFPQP